MQPAAFDAGRVSSLRERLDLSQAEVAAYLGVHPSTVSRYESGDQVPNAHARSHLADYFGVTVDSFFRPQFPWHVLDPADLRQHHDFLYRPLRRLMRSYSLFLDCYLYAGVGLPGDLVAGLRAHSELEDGVFQTLRNYRDGSAFGLIPPTAGPEFRQGFARISNADYWWKVNVFDDTVVVVWDRERILFTDDDATVRRIVHDMTEVVSRLCQTICPTSRAA